VIAHARLVIDRAGARTVTATAPFGFRRSGDTWFAVQTAAGPLGGDELHLDVEVLPGGRLTMRSVAAQLAQPGPREEPAHLHITMRVDHDAVVDWALEPLVLVQRAHLVSSTHIDLAETARLRWRDEVVLGRHLEPAGRLDAVLRVTRAGRVAMHHEPDHSTYGIGSSRVTITEITTAIADGTVLDDGPNHWGRLPSADPTLTVLIGHGRTLDGLRQSIAAQSIGGVAGSRNAS
jgi:urease accessory protein